MQSLRKPPALGMARTQRDLPREQGITFVTSVTRAGAQCHHRAVTAQGSALCEMTAALPQSLPAPPRWLQKVPQSPPSPGSSTGTLGVFAGLEKRSTRMLRWVKSHCGTSEPAGGAPRSRDRSPEQLSSAVTQGHPELQNTCSGEGSMV